ncbi:terpenoid synthase [Stipitochalara longipes BDJ]|nr:terpenoid synthase [Stipitochalara longipes BDJ]
MPSADQNSKLQQDTFFSQAIPLDEIKSYGCYTILPARRHNNVKLFEQANAEIRALWNDNFHDSLIEWHSGTTNKVSGDWDVLVYPGCRPGRERYITWISQFFFLVDDKADQMTREEAHSGFNRQIREIISGEGKMVPQTPLEKVLVHVMQGVLAVDHERGMISFNAWLDWLRISDVYDVTDFDNIDSYVEYRISNVAFPAMCAMLPFAMELDINSEDLKPIEPFLHAAGASIAMTNDYWSWPKEFRASSEGNCRIMNAVTIIMTEKNITMDQAHEMVKELALKYEKEAVFQRDSIVSRNVRLPENVQRYMNAVVWLASGNNLWSSTTPRYHSNNGKTVA